LTVAGVGTGFAEDERVVGDTRPAEMPVLDPGMWCPDAACDELADLAGEDGAFVEIEQGRWPNFHGVSGRLCGSEDADVFIDRVSSGFGDASARRGTSPTKGATASVAALVGARSATTPAAASSRYVIPGSDGDCGRGAARSLPVSG
jgi:hypothetical protein